MPWLVQLLLIYPVIADDYRKKLVCGEDFYYSNVLSNTLVAGATSLSPIDWDELDLPERQHLDGQNFIVSPPPHLLPFCCLICAFYGA
jgi:hypothetical protein